MNRRHCLVLFFSLFFTSSLYAQRTDSTLAWADRLLLEEIPFPVITRLTRTQSLDKLSSINRLTEACLLSLEFSKADAFLHHGDSLARKSNNPEEQAYLQMNWSRYRYERSEYALSAAHALESLRLLSLSKIKSHGNELLRMRSTLQLGKTYLQLRRMKEARVNLDAANNFFSQDSIRYAIPLAQTNFALGLWSKISDQLVPAIGYYERAIGLFETSENERYLELGKCFNNLASVYSEQGDYGNAKLYYLKALEFKKKHVTDSLSLAITYNNLGKFYTDYGNNYQARDCYEKSISLLNEKDPRCRERIPEFLNNYGTLLMEIDEEAGAEKNFRKSLQILNSESVNSGKQLSPALSLAGLLMIRGDLKEAEDLLNKAEKMLADSQSTKRSLATWHLRKANLYGMQGHVEQAEPQYRQALSLIQPANTLLASEIYLQLGQLELKRKDYSQALGSFRISHAIVEENLPVNHPQLCSTFNMIGETFLYQRMTDSAIYYFQQAVDRNVADKKSTHPGELEAVYPFEMISSFYFLSQSYQQRYASNGNISDLQKSASYVDLGLRAIDSQRKSLAMTNDQLTFDDRVAIFFERAMEAYYEIQQKQGRPDNLEKMFYISELSKSQSLGQALRESNLRSFSNVSVTLRKEEETLRNKIQTIDLQSLKELKYGSEANPDLTREYQQELSVATDRYQRLQDSIRQNLPGYFQLKYNKVLVTSADIQQDILAVEPNTALVQFMAGDSAVYCQVITGHGQLVYRIENAPELKNRVLTFRNQIKLGIKDGLNENAVWLYDKLLRKAESLLRSTKVPVHQLIIIPDQILCYLPFEALIRNFGTNKFLVTEMDISYAYSSTLLWQKYKERSTASHTSAFIGLAPVFTTSESPRVRNTRDDSEGAADRFQFQPLTGNLTEVNSISLGMEKKKVRSSVLEGQQATEASFRKLNLKQYDYVHFATHGFVDMDNPQHSGVAFSRNTGSPAFDDILFTNEVYEMQFNARLVCLSSCESGIGKIYRGDGMIGLAQAFLFAGARNLVVSLWKVDDSATRDLMIDFYSRLPGKSLSAALSGAKRKMAASKNFNHPYYWSSFILIGL